MNIDSNFIFNVVSRIHGHLQSQNLCPYANWTPGNANYSDGNYQGIYAVRYLPAYYFEYAILAEILHTRVIAGQYTALNIASFGCGLYPDYFALEHNFTAVPFNYTGYDSCAWQTRSLMPPTNRGIILNHQPIDTITTQELNTFDVFIFPKSIGDIHATSVLDAFAKKIAATAKSRIFFLNSFIIRENNNNISEVSLFGKIHNELLQQGFTTQDDHINTFHCGQQGSALRSLNNNFNYPSGYALCNKTTSECTNSCTVRYSPILTNRNMGYQFLEYTR